MKKGARIGFTILAIITVVVIAMAIGDNLSDDQWAKVIFVGLWVIAGLVVARVIYRKIKQGKKNEEDKGEGGVVIPFDRARRWKK